MRTTSHKRILSHSRIPDSPYPFRHIIAIYSAFVSLVHLLRDLQSNKQAKMNLYSKLKTILSAFPNPPKRQDKMINVYQTQHRKSLKLWCVTD